MSLNRDPLFGQPSPRKSHLIRWLRRTNVNNGILPQLVGGTEGEWSENPEREEEGEQMVLANHAR